MKLSARWWLYQLIGLVAVVIFFGYRAASKGRIPW
jgi:hypothetical protein